jgi:hypothetical protein
MVNDFNQNDFNQNAPQPAPPMQSSSSGKGCLWGCLIAFGLGICLLLCAGFGSYFWLRNEIAKYTSETPKELQTVDYEKEEMEALETRVESFRTKLDEGQTPEEDLVLTAEEINALIGNNEDLRGRVFVKIEDGQVKGDVSFPLDKLGVKGRYFNGSGTFDVSMENGELVVNAQEAVVNDEPVPEQFMTEFRKQNLAKEFYDDADSAKFLRKFEDIRVEGDKIILKVRRDQDAASSGSETQESGEETSAGQTDSAGSGDAEASGESGASDGAAEEAQAGETESAAAQ